MGPSTDPCGTPMSIVRGSDNVFPILTTCFLLVKYDCKSARARPRIPCLSSFCSNNAWLTESNAFARSRNIVHVTLFLSKLFGVIKSYLSKNLINLFL